MKKLTKKQILLIFLAACLVLAMIPLTMNAIMLLGTMDEIREITAEDGYRVAVVLGAKVHEGGRLSHMLQDRMDTAIALYHAGAVETLLVSGDGRGEWSETKHMKAYAIENGVHEEDILMDDEGFSTYESIFRAKKEFLISKFVIVTQKYHLYRALYIAEDMDIDALGADAAIRGYSGQLYRELREILARCKDMVVCAFD